MKNSSKYILALAAALANWPVAPRASAQTRAGLVLNFSAGKPALSVTGGVGTIYSIQYVNGLSPTNRWTDRTLLQVQGAGTVWTDPLVLTPSQRFYRAVSVPVPLDTNLVFIQPGTFTMGSPASEALRYADTPDPFRLENQHKVTISRGFWMENHSVTQGSYLAVVGSNPSYFNGNRSGPPDNDRDFGIDLNRPVEQVTWVQATNYCALRTAQEQAAGLIPTNYVYRLPTESEWEYARRAGTTTPFNLGNGLRSGEANFNGHFEYDAALGEISNPNGIWLEVTTPVRSYAANGWGLYDMIGNVFQWCQDWLNTYPLGSVTDPQGAATGPGRVLRGGCWYSPAQNCRAAVRFGAPPV